MPAEATLARMFELLDDEPLEVSQEIVGNDGMYKYAPELYPVAGQTALRCVRLAMLAAQLQTAERILDFASGGGRVLRYLRAAFPDAAITACDVVENQVEFCTRVFGAIGVVSDPDPQQIELDGPFDVIWCGSLLTHVDRELWLGLLDLMRSVLAPGGVMVFTVYGPLMAAALKRGDDWTRMQPEQVQQMVRDYDEHGFGYQAVAGSHQGHGDCLVTPAWVCAQLQETTPDLDLLLYLQGVWLGQDVVACTKRA
jgi:cyclopropane fatty-acyl-phospholipid synthase-like methyltransferase